MMPCIKQKTIQAESHEKQQKNKAKNCKQKKKFEWNLLALLI